MKQFNKLFDGLHTFIILWATQSFSQLGSSMTSYALVIWAYRQTGSALATSLLSICSYAPYVLLSIFAGALSDKWNKKYTMLYCDTFAACTTVLVLVLLLTNRLELWHLYVINGVNGLMNTLQQPASDVAVTLLTPKEQYQRVGGMRSFSSSLVTILTPVIATFVLSFWGITAVIAFDLTTFILAFATLAFFIQIPNRRETEKDSQTSILSSVREGLSFLSKNRGILDLILFLAAINLTASMYNAALPAMLLSRNGGGNTALGLVNGCTGLANLAGSVIVSLSRPPKSRVKAIVYSLMISMSVENFLLAFGRTIPVWCLGSVIGWLLLPNMNANMDVLFRLHIPIEMQGRIYSVRNSLQFFTIPIGYLLGGLLVDKVMEPLMSRQTNGSFLTLLFGNEKGSGAAFLFFFLGIMGVVTCLVFNKSRHIWALEK